MHKAGLWRQTKAQTAVEYIMLVGAVIFLVILVFLVARDRIFNTSGSNINNSSGAIASLTRNVTR